MRTRLSKERKEGTGAAKVAAPRSIEEGENHDYAIRIVIGTRNIRREPAPEIRPQDHRKQVKTYGAEHERQALKALRNDKGSESRH